MPLQLFFEHFVVDQLNHSRHSVVPTANVDLLQTQIMTVSGFLWLIGLLTDKSQSHTRGRLWLSHMTSFSVFFTYNIFHTVWSLTVVHYINIIFIVR